MNMPKKTLNIKTGACSVVVDNNIVGRNLDWLYSEMADCIIQTEANIGVAGANAEFTKAFADSRLPDEHVYKLMPFYLQDGINMNGLCVSTLVAPNITSKSYVGSEERSINSIMLVRYLLDNFSSASEAVDDLQYNTSVFFPAKLLEMGYNQHWVICDSNHTFLFEIDENERPVIIDYSGHKLVVTNFHHHNVEFNSDGTVYTPATQNNDYDAVKTNKVHEYGAGLERYNILVQQNTNSIGNMKQALQKVAYSKIYNIENAMFTDFCSEEESLRCNTDVHSFEAYINYIQDKYEHRSRDKDSEYFGFWNTNHSSVYDLNNKAMSVCSQENYWKWHEYKI